MQAPTAPHPEADTARWPAGGAAGSEAEPASAGLSVDALAGTGAAAFAALVLWTLPAFLGLPGSAGLLASLVGSAAVAYAVAGPHPGGDRFRRLLPVIAVAAGFGAALVRILLPGGIGAAAAFLGTTSGEFSAWAAGASSTLPAPASLVMAAAAGLLVGLPVFHAARVGRPAVALLLGFTLLVVEWEFVDDATVRLFWPLVAISLFWLAADRARETARAGQADVGSPTPWTAFGVATLAAAVVAGVLLLVPRQGAPANLGVLGLWIDHLPVIGSIEKATREGNLGYGATTPGADSGAGGGSGPSLSPAARTDGFSLAATGFTANVGKLGGPAQPDNRQALQITLSSTSNLPPAIYLRGAAFDRYNGQGWVPDADAQSPDPGWPTANAGDIGREFLRGQPLPAPYHQVAGRISLVSAAGANLFTLLLPLRLSVTGVNWDQTGEVWSSGPLPSGFAYDLTAAVLGPEAYTGTDLAAYTSPAAPGQRLSPTQAEHLALAGAPVAQTAIAPGIQADPLPLAEDVSLPPTVPRRVRDLAKTYAGGTLGDPLLEALAIQAHLLADFQYTLSAPPVPPGQDFADFFLFRAHQGYCTSYSTAMVVMLRSLGVAARWVEGYRVAVPPQGGSFQVRDSDAHAWVEVYVPQLGWLTFDPTPGAVPSALPATSQVPPQGGFAHGLLAEAGAVRAWVVLGVPAFLALLLAITAAANFLSERPTDDSPLEQAQVVWRACERVGARYGCPRHGHLTPAEYAAALGQRLPSVTPAAAALAAAFGRLRYGPGADAAKLRAHAGDLQVHWLELQAGLREVSPVTYPFRRWL